MKKFISVFLLVSVFLLLPTLLLAFDETLVELIVYYSDKTVKAKEIYDALEEDGCLLLPLSEVTQDLDLEIDFDRASGVFKVTSLNTLESLTFTTSGYKDIPALRSKKPKTIDNEVFVHVNFFEALLSAKSKYDPSQLSLEIHLSYSKPTMFLFQPVEQVYEVNEPEIFEASLKPLTLSSLEYQLKHSIRREFSQTEGDLFLHFRSGLASITTGLHLDSKNYSKPTVSKPFFRLMLEKNNTLFVLGNTSFVSETKLGSRAIFGLTIITPYPQIYTQYPILELKLQGKKGDTAVIFINDEPIRSIKITDDEPFLVNLNLKPYRLQEIRVENATLISNITYRNGLKLLTNGSSQTKFYAGYYAKDNQKYEGELLEFVDERGITDNTTLNTKIIWQAPDYKLKSPLLQLTLLSEIFPGISALPSLYLSGDGSLGAEYALISSLPMGFWRLRYFNLPDVAGEYYSKNTEKGLDLFLEADLTNQVQFQLSAEALLKTSVRPLLRSYRAALTLNTLSPLSNYLIAYGHKESYLNTINEFIFDNNLTLGYNLRQPSLSLKANYIYQVLTVLDRDVKKHEFKGSFVTNISPKTALSIENQLFSQVNDETNSHSDLTFEYYLNPKINLYSSVSLDQIFKPKNEILNQNYKLGINLNFGHPGLRLEAQKNIGHRGNYQLYSAFAYLNYTNIRYTLSCSIKFPKEQKMETAFKASLNKTFDNGLALGLSFEKLPVSLLTGKAEYIAAITISHGISFTKDGILGHKYKGDTLSSSVSGKVFLDLNGNGLLDNGEQGIEGIEMRLGYLKATTNKDGSFTFTNIEPLIYNLGFDPKKLNADYTAPLLSFPVKISTGDNLTFDMPLTMNGVLKGKVFIDVDGDGTFSEEDTPLDWIQIKIKENNHRVFSDKLGNYYFENLPLGTFTIEIDEKTLPIAVKPLKPITIVITPDQLDTILDLPLKY